MQLGVGGLQVVELDGFAEQLLVEGQCEAAVDVVTVEDRQAHHAAHKVKIGQVVLRTRGSGDGRHVNRKGPLLSLPLGGKSAVNSRG